MNYRSALLIEQAAAHVPALEEGIRSIGFQYTARDPDQAVEYLKHQSLEGNEPAVVVIAPEVPNVVPLARRIRAVWPYGEVLFVPGPQEIKKLRNELRYAPMIGSNWSVSELDNPRLPQMIEKAATSSRQRLRLRTTIGQANQNLKHAPRINEADYHRLAVSEHYLASVLEQSQDAIISLDMRQAVLFWSAGAERLFDVNAQQMVGKRIREASFWSQTLDSALEDVHLGTRVLTVETRTGAAEHPMDLEVLFSGVHDHAGRLIGTSLTVRDISARKQMIEAERAARRRAEEASKLKDEFLAILSHELRTPLSTIIGRTQLLQLKFAEQKELLPSLDVIARNAQLQAKLIEDLLDISAISAGKVHLRLESLDLTALLQEAIETVRSSVAAKKLQIDAKFPDRATSMQGDPLRLKQVFLNILNNAVKFTPEHGRISVALEESAEELRITITDTGIGISPDFLPHVFSRFGQADSSASRSYGGLGLGLSIADQLVAMHGGRIQARSKGKDEGATFVVHLSRSLSSRREKKPPRPAARGGFKPTASLNALRVLVVEDVPDARAMMVEILQSHGAIVCEAGSGAQALQLLTLFAPDILISDVGMPGMDGYELLKRVRAMGYSREQLPALAVTAFASEADREQAIKAGFERHVAKPLIVNELVETVIEVCSGEGQVS